MLVRVGTQVQEVLRRTDIRRRGPTPVNTARLRVVLRDVEPAVARVIDVPASATLPELHELLQAAIGWTDSHLHQFVTPQATYGMEIPGAEVWPEDQRDETGARLADLGTEFEYLYDFGDGWTHDVEVLGPGGSAPGCVDGDVLVRLIDTAVVPAGTPNRRRARRRRAAPEHAAHAQLGSATGCGCSTAPYRPAGAPGRWAAAESVPGRDSISPPTESNLLGGGCDERWCAT